MRVSLLAAASILLLAPRLDAQLNVQWANFRPDPTRLSIPTDLTANETEVDFAWGDVDQDGDVDIIVVRKSRWSTGGKRTNVILLNLDGVLTDVTATYGAASDVAGDQGFLTPTNDREVVLTDMDVDGWLDVVTATTISDGDPKHLSHPRVYRNLGSSSGVWAGIKHEDARMPRLLSLTGVAGAPRFCDVAAGDIDGDGAPELHFVDYDQGLPSMLLAHDYNDRLLSNDGNGFFTDVTTSRLLPSQTLSSFGLNNRIVDMNGDGRNDIVKLTALLTPYDCLVLHNEPLGFFQALGSTSSGGTTTYGMDVADLNNDGRPDLAMQMDSQDRFRLNLGNDALGRVIWGPLNLYSFAGGNDDGFGHKVRIEDVDDDGWNDVFICDYDIDIVGCNGRRLHVYHNLGGAPGSTVTMKEEAQLASGDKGPGWKGLVGLHVSDLTGTMDLAFGDFDGDGDKDFVQARCDGVFFWGNRAIVCADDLGGASPSGPALSVCGPELTKAGSVAQLELTGATPSAPVWLVAGLTQAPTPFVGGVLLPTPTLVISGLATDAAGTLTLPVPGGAGPVATVFAQAVVGGALSVSNAVVIKLGS